jgi:peptidyl-prolyl cis-trans isomerase SurA
MRYTLFVPLLLLLSTTLFAAVEELNGIAAVVDDDVITWSELDRRVETVAQQLRQKNTRLPPRDILERQILERLILEQLQLKQAEQLGIRVNDEELNKVVANIASKNNLTLEQFRAALARDGLSFAFFREQIRNELVMGRLRSNQVDNRVNVTPQEVDAFLEGQRGQQERNSEYHLYHILVSVPGSASPEQVQASRAKAEEVLGKLRDGADFRQMAVAYSDGQQALEGGDLGWRRAAQLPSLFAEVVLEMQPGQVSGLIRSSSGFHILQLADKRGQERQLIRQVHARHILLKTSPLVSDSEARNRLLRLRERIRGGEPFAELARAHSEDPGSAVKGGDLGWADPSIYVREFQEALNNNPVGTISEPFKSQFGWHIMEVLAWRDYDNTEEARRNQAFQALRQRKIEEAEQNWLRRLRDEAYVELRLER